MFHARTTLPETTSIYTERLVLRPLAASDFGDLVAEVNDFAVTRMLAKVPYPYGRREAEAFLAHVARTRNELALMIARGGKVIGGIGASSLDGRAEFGYWLGRAHWGKGYATEAARAFLSFVFDFLGLPELHSGVFIDNPASLRVQEKLGFRQVGRRLVPCLARGESVEHIDTLLTRAEFERVRQ